MFVLLPSQVGLLHLDEEFLPVQRIFNGCIQEVHLICAIPLSYSRIINISRSYYRYLYISKARLDNFQNFLHELSAKLLGFFFVDSWQKFQSLKHFVGVSLWFMLLKTVFMRVTFTCLSVLNVTYIAIENLVGDAAENKKANQCNHRVA